MLILIAGVTGNIGSKLIQPLIDRGAQVRGFARSKSKLGASDLAALESFHSIESWYDVAAIRRALKGVDAVICAYAPDPQLALEAQLLLVRLVEEAGITLESRLVGPLMGDVPYYDVFLSLKRQMEISSKLTPFFIFTGILAEAFFSVPGHGGFSPTSHGVWDPIAGAPRAEVWGSGEEKWQLTTEQDTADYTAELVMDMSQKGGLYRFCSMELSIKEIVAEYERMRQTKVTIIAKGSVAELKEEANKSQKSLGLPRFWEWMGYYYQYVMLSGKVLMPKLDNGLYSNIKPTDLEGFLRQWSEV